MKKIIITLLSLIAVTTATYAQVIPEDIPKESVSTPNATIEENTESVITLKSKKRFSRRKRKAKATIGKQKVNSKLIKTGSASEIFADATTVLKTLPGVTGGDMNAAIFIRGGSSDELLVVQDNHYYDFPYFFGGMVSILNPKYVEDITFYTGGFPARYGNVLSGVIDAKTKIGNKINHEFELEQNVSELNWLAQGPIQKYKSSYIFSARRTYYDYIVALALDGDTLVPFYESYQGKLDFELTDRQRLTLGYSNFHDKADVKSDGEDFFGAKFKAESKTHEIQAELNSQWTPNFETITGIQHEQYDVFFHLQETRGVKVDVDRAPYAFGHEFKYTKDKHVVRGGLMHWQQKTNIQTEFTRLPDKRNPLAVTENITSLSRIESKYNAVYLEDEYELIPKKLMVNPGLRYEWVANDELTKAKALQPRLLVYMGDRSKSVWTAAIGRYTQFNFETFDDQLVDLEPSEAIHYNLGYEKNTPWWMFRAEVYYKNYDNLSFLTEDPTTGVATGYTNDKVGFAKGFELFIQKKEGEKNDGWISYTLGEVRNNDPKEGWFYPEYDQRHTLNIVLNRKLNTLWSMTTKLRWSSGKPYTQLLGREQNANGEWAPIWGPTNGTRTSSYSRLDLLFRYAKPAFPFNKFNFEGETYFGVTNLFNTVNIQGYDTEDDFSEQAPISGLGRLPVVGTTIKF